MNRSTLALASIGLLGAALAPTAQADQWNKRTILMVNEPVQVPTRILSPGKYVMKLLDSQSDRHIVQIFNADETHLLATILALPNYRLQPTGHSRFVFWETPPGQPKALRAWFYPGDNFGQEFTYSKRELVAFASVTQVQMPVTQAEPIAPAPTTAAAEVETPAEPTVQATEEVAEVAQATPPAAPAAPEPQAEPEADRLQTPPPADTLPHTASAVPWIGLSGLISVLGFFALRLKRVDA